ncbi:MAG: radical SAM protein [Candidatus Omnitrophica bacterium]|nr:radical SAM protein [Candidatus Omnitrophota bacterium]
MKLALISPARKDDYDFWDFKFAAQLLGRKYGGGAPLALPTIAALTPKDVKITLIDENIESINYQQDVDLIGITFNTSLAPRAYEIANNFRKRNIPVILGGIHASMLPEEASKFANSVVVGEAELIWSDIIKDFRQRKLKSIYYAPKFPDLAHSPVPRWDLLKNKLYNIHIMQTARGCPFKCEFCSVTSFLGNTYRPKPIQNVIHEIETLLRIDKRKGIFFADDNIVFDTERAKELFTAITPFKIKYWWGQVSLNVAKDDKLLKLMYKSGCRQLLIGFESLRQENLDLIKKNTVNKRHEYIELINRIHHSGISIVGAFVLGEDYDDEKTFDEIINFVQESNIAFPQISILTPLVGTSLYKRLKKDQRLLHESWEKYTFSNVCFRPKFMSEKILEEGYIRVLKEIYSYPQLYSRLVNLWKSGVLIKRNYSISALFSRTRLMLTLKAFLSFDKQRFNFVIRSLWKIRNASLVAVLFGLNLHDFAYKFKNGKQ